jgi:hypothetical protein
MTHDNKTGSLRELFMKHRVRSPVAQHPYLEPYRSPFSPLDWGRGYRAMFKSFLEAGVREVDRIAFNSLHPETVGVVCLPTGQTWWALWLVGERKYGFSIVSTKLCRAEARSETAPSGEPSKHDDTEITVDSAITSSALVRVAEIPADLGPGICAAWKQVLLATRHRDDRHGVMPCDGTTYHFSYGSMAGHTWCPPDDIVPGKLVALSNALYDFAWSNESRDPVLVRTIDQRLRNLNEGLAANR